MINPFGSAPKTDPAHASQIKEWIRQSFGLSDDVTVMVSELRCQEDDCPEVETVIAVLLGNGQDRKHKLMKPIVDVTREDILSLAARGTHG